MNARSFLVCGLLAGLLAGLATMVVAFTLGEPQVDTAIALEESGSSEPQPEAEEGHDHADGAAAHSHGAEDEGTEVSRDTQKTWGLLTGSVTVGLALGGLIALIAAATMGRLGNLRPGQSTAVIALLGFVSFALVPFLKYPATPPAVGSGDTIGDRTSLYFGFVLVSVLAMAAATYGALRLRDRIGTYAGVVAGSAVYLVVMLIAGQLFSTVNEVGDFPADTLWFFRRASLLTLATMWGVLGVVLSGLVSGLYARELARAECRQPLTA